MLPRVAAWVLFVAVLAGALVPCGEPPPETGPAALAATATAAEVDDGAWCGRSDPPQLLPACACGCAQRPQVAGVPVGVGLAVLAALPRVASPPALPAPPIPLTAVALAGVVRTPDPVPLVVAS